MSGVCDICGGCASDPCSMTVHEEAAAEQGITEFMAWLVVAYERADVGNLPDIEQLLTEWAAAGQRQGKSDE